jgi:diaminohydroxyphosphoribosylaminopyrimidine deaminase/5-amino-6-(5-phosphoribosylamino)uracil reductase
MERLERAGAKIHPVATTGDASILDLDEVMAAAWELGIRSILCEGGAALAASLLRSGLAHRLYLFMAPTTLGARGVAAFPDDADRLDWSSFTQVVRPVAFGSDALIVLDRQED